MMTTKSDIDLPDVVYTDGCCTDNGKDGANGGIGVYWAPNHPCNLSEKLEGKQTNNRAEINAAIRAIEQALESGKKALTICTDSNFMISCMTKWISNWKSNGWKLANGEPVKNQLDLKRLDELCNHVKITWRHVRGHQGIEGNEMADLLAKKGSLKGPVTSNSDYVQSKDVSGKKRKLSSDTEQTIAEKKEKVSDSETKNKDTSCNLPNSLNSASAASKDSLPDVAFISGCSFYHGKNSLVSGVGVFYEKNSVFNLSEKLIDKYTSNAADILAAYHAVQQAIKFNKQHIVLCTENEFLLNCMTKWVNKWKKNNWENSSGESVKNKEELIALDEICQQLKVTWKYIKGQDENNAAKELAKAGAKKEVILENDVSHKKCVTREEYNDTKRNVSDVKLSQIDLNTVYVCGVFKPQKNGGIYCLGIYWGPEDPRNVSKILDGVNQTTKRAELNACIIAIEQALEASLDSMRICCSTDYVFNCGSKWIHQWAKKDWRTSSGEIVKNKEELLRLKELNDRIEIQWILEENKECRKLAFQAK